MFETDNVVIGAGVIGLAVARELAVRGEEVVVLEGANTIGAGVSSRNSEVIHAGIYYPAGSLKARLCVEGKRLLYAHCQRAGIAHRRCGKLIVATAEAELNGLHLLLEQARANGVDDLQLLGPSEATALEPEVRCMAALLSPSTGIIDSHGLMLSLQGELEARGGVVALSSHVVSMEIERDRIIVRTGGDSEAELSARVVVNAAGHGAVALATGLADYPRQLLPRQGYCKGNYFALAGQPPFSRLIYPMPEVAGLGVHATLDLAGRVRFGPDVEWIADARTHDVAPSRADDFYPAIRRYWPGLLDGALYPDYAGIRPKLHHQGEPSQDFRIEGQETHGVPGLVNLFGIESPGLTASLAIAGHVCGLLER